MKVFCYRLSCVSIQFRERKKVHLNSRARLFRFWDIKTQKKTFYEALIRVPQVSLLTGGLFTIAICLGTSI